MKSITIHNLDDQLETLLLKKAKSEGKSLNKTIKKLLAEALGLDAERDGKPNKEFQDLFGVWSANDVQEFKQRTSELGKIDPGDWR